MSNLKRVLNISEWDKKNRNHLPIYRKKNGQHYGNPFSHRPNTLAAVQVATLEEAIARFETWLTGKTDRTVEPDRRRWILNNLEPLRDRCLICFCAPPGGVDLGDPLCCHGQIYLRALEGLLEGDLKKQIRQERIRGAIRPWTGTPTEKRPVQPKIIQGSLF